ncbi:MAG: shikimate kinase [Akkermansia sp.]
MVPMHPLDTKGHPIILIGLMGCGKSTVGKALSMRTGMPLLDTDAVIEEQVGKSIPDIFAERGEAHFRMLETALLRYIEGRHPAPPPIISTGGGIIIRKENRELLHRLGFVVWLNVGVGTLLARTAHGSNRPLLQNTDRAAVLAELLHRRYPFYAETAHLQMDSSRMDANTAAYNICLVAERFFKQRRPRGEKPPEGSFRA